VNLNETASAFVLFRLCRANVHLHALNHERMKMNYNRTKQAANALPN